VPLGANSAPFGHELKNPLFPLQVTVENLMRAKTQSAPDFEEVFHEGTPPAGEIDI